MPSSRDATGLIRSILLTLIVVVKVASTDAGTLVERTVAFVNKRPVLLSDVKLARALLKLDHDEAIERSIDESLMFEEASRLVSEAPSAEATAAALRALGEKAGSTFSAAALRRKALIQLTISSYIDLRLRPLVRVEDDEVRKAFNDGLLEGPAVPPFSEAAPATRDSLEARALDERIEEWVASLRLRADIRRPAEKRPTSAPVTH